MNIIEVNLKNDLKNIVMSLYSFSYTFESVHSEKCRKGDFGDYTSAIALGLAKKLNRAPKEISDEVMTALEKTGHYATINMSGPGFINVTGSAHNFNEVKSFEGTDLPKLDQNLTFGVRHLLAGAWHRKLKISEQARNVLKRIKGIRRVLNDEGIDSAASGGIDKNLFQEKLVSHVFDGMYLSGYYKKMDANISALMDYDSEKITEIVYLNTLQELLDTFGAIEKQVVYRKYNRNELTIIEKLYYEFQQIFDKIT